MRPLAIDLFAGKGGWTNGLQACGWQCIGFDIADMGGYPGELVLQDVLTLHGSQFRNAGLIVASPPCQEFAVQNLPWTRLAIEMKPLVDRWNDDGGAQGREYYIPPKPSTALFDACFRIQREASEAAGRHIPMVVENVKGAQPWVGPARWHYGSFYLWGDVPALMPTVGNGRMKFPAPCGPRLWKDREIPRLNNGENEHAFHQATENSSVNIGEDLGQILKLGAAVDGGIPLWQKEFGLPGEPDPHGKGIKGLGNGRDGQDSGIKQPGLSGKAWFDHGTSEHSSRSAARKKASARIAMIPFILAKHIGEVYLP